MFRVLSSFTGGGRQREIAPSPASCSSAAAQSASGTTPSVRPTGIGPNKLAEVKVDRYEKLAGHRSLPARIRSASQLAPTSSCVGCAETYARFNSRFQKNTSEQHSERAVRRNHRACVCLMRRRQRLQ
jgi:hypothetical protein